MSNADLVTRGKALVPHCDDPSDYTEDDRTILAMADRIEALEAEVARLREENDIISEMLTERKARANALEEALRAIADDCEADYPPSHGAIKHAARRALAQKE